MDVDERWTPEGPFDYTLFQARTPGFDRVERQRQQVEAAERVRTLYVAMTRARERLVLTGTWDRPGEPKPVQQAASYLDLLYHRGALPRDLESLEARAARRGWVDAHGARWRFPGEPVETRLPFQTETPAPLASPEQVEREALALRERRRRARQRMERHFSGAASDESDARLQNLFTTEASRGPGSRPAALAVGEEVHRLFETWDFTANREEELARRRDRALQALEGRLSGDDLEAGRQRLAALLERLASGSLLERFHSIGPRVLGREVPIALAPDDPGDTRAPVGLISGVVDLVYRDPDSGDPVLVDFKTDRVETEQEIAERVEAYAGQEAVYRRAIRDAFKLSSLPAFELWFLWPDRLWRAP